MDMELLKNAVADLEEDLVMDMLNDCVSKDENVLEAMRACQEGMSEVGNRFEVGEYFVADLVYAGEIMTAAMDILKPALQKNSTAEKAKMILCTVEGDLHDIGKNIVRAMLEADGFEVIDLGIDTPAEKVVEAVKANDVYIVGLSGVLTLAIDAMKKTVEAFEAAGLREKTKIIIGGSPITEKACEITGADDWAVNPQKTVEVCKAWSLAK